MSKSPPDKKPVSAKTATKPAASKKAAGVSARAKKPKVMGRPTIYSDALATRICAELSDGISLRQICSVPSMPDRGTVIRWLANPDHGYFCIQYACAREAQADRLAEEMLEIADEDCSTVRADKHGSRDDDGEGNTEVVFDAVAVARNRLRVDARKWLASKMAPKKYGDKLTQELTGPNGGALQVNSTVTFVLPPSRREDDQ
jgi:hypothetical protein